MNSIRALIVDDSSVMRKIVERSLRQAGIELKQVLEAGNGAEALSVLKDNPVDLILCDINMPVMDGLEFVKQLSTIENGKNVPVVMITTEGSESHVVQALSAGALGLPQALYGRPGQAACYPCAGGKTMRPVNPMLAPHEPRARNAPHCSNWQRGKCLNSCWGGTQLAVPDTVTDGSPDITSMVGLAGQLCGVLSVAATRSRPHS